jgi:hypothetical protein
MRHYWNHSGNWLFYLAVISLTLVFWPASRIYAADYYVAANGSNTNPGTATQPWRNVDYAVDNASPGDTIFVRGGTYNERVTISVSGTAGEYITLRGYSGETPILDGTGLGNGTMIYGENISYFKIIGFEIRNHTGAGIAFQKDGTHIEIRDNRIHSQSFSSGDGHAILISAVDPSAWKTANYTNHTITDVIVDGNTIGPNVFTGEGSIYNEALTIAFNVKRFQITNNTIDDVSHIGTSLIGKTNPFGFGGLPAFPQYGRIAGNTYKNISFTGGSPQPNSAIHVDGAKDIVIEENLVHDSRNYGIDLIAEDTTFVNERIITRRNSLLRMQTGLYSMGYNNLSNHIRHAHNSVFLNSGTHYGIALDTGNDVILKNNIVQVATFPSRALNHVNGTSYSPSLDSNLYAVSSAIFSYKGKEYLSFPEYKSSTQQDTRSLTGDPMYMNPANNDLKLQTGSPANDAGTCLTTTSGTGSNSRTLVVKDSRWFHDGMGIAGLPGDLIQIGSNNPVEITAVNYSTNQITLGASISWSDNACASYPYADLAPDIGAFETGSRKTAGSPITRPLAPQNLIAR